MKVKLPTGTTAENNQLLLPAGMLSIDTERKAVRLHDGLTQGGFEVLGTQAVKLLEGPGSNVLIAGDEVAGFYGEVPVEDFFRGDDLADMIGLTAGDTQHSEEPWLKFALDGRTLLVAKKPYRHTLSWDDIQTANAVYGDQTVTHKGVQYRVRLLKGASTDPSGSDSSGYDTPSTHGSEWNRLMYRVALGNTNDVFTSAPAHSDWAQYTDADLVFAAGDGRYSWCQEAWGGDTNRRVRRGGFGVSGFHNIASSGANSSSGWRPCLELVE